MNTNPIQSSTEQSINDQPYGVPPALWNPTVAGILSLLLTPIFGEALVLLNWKTLGAKEKIRSSQIWLIISILMILVYFYVGGLILVLPFLYFLIWYIASARVQAKYIDERWKKEYPRKSWLYPVLFGIAGMVTFIICGSLFFFFSLILRNTN